MDSFYIERGEYHLYSKRINQQQNSFTNETLVLLHDSWGCVEMWNEFTAIIAETSGMDVFLYDRRGYGKSSPFAISERTEFYLHDEADELMWILNEYSVQNPVIYGHSDGATIALIAAAKYPDRIKGLILEGAHSFIEDSGKAAVLATREKAKHTGLLQSLEKYHGDKTGELFRLWHETWLSDYFANWTIVPMLHTIKCPVLAFQGENDEFGTINQLKVLKENISGFVSVFEIPAAGHTPRKEAADVTLEIIRDWFRKNKW